ncbi:HNH endonuclease [Streptomyces sp. NBC_00536]|uniref:HNH endonuclease n=1 Tax=Streptomyces sp. NBC_00536 TaxID=2975769 RepID=UPI002E819BEB|nr:HNH endonuclease [Streptomyces sp. NBC_00536]WUC83573.1 HNH endonuclease [Streptomyces sp. NBC_00536]
MCATVLALPSPRHRYSEAAHIRAREDNGPDIVENLLCLCPTCHVLFDAGARVLTDDLTIVDTVTGQHGKKSNSTGGISSTPGMFTTTVGAGPAKTCLRSQARHRHSPSSEALQRRPSARALATERHCARTPARPRSGPVAGQQRTSEGRSRRFAWSGAVSKNLLAASICTGIRIRRRQVDLRGQIPHPRSLRFAPPRPQTRRAQRSVTSTEPARVRLRGVLTWAFGSAPNQHGSRHRPSKTGATRQFRRGLSVGCSRLWSTPPTRVWPWGT